MSDAQAYAETLYPQREFGWAPLFAWRTARHKMIEAPRPELYDLEKDPRETANRAGSENARLVEMRQRLEVVLSRTAPSAAAEVDPEAAERLRALGYVAGGGGAPVAAGTTLRDPKDGQRLVPRLNRCMSVVRTDPAAAIRDLTAVLAEDPGLLMARRSLAVAYTSAHQYEKAIAELRRLERDGILSAEDGIVLGDNLRFAGRLDEATAVLERTARENPRFAQPWISLAEIHGWAKRGFLRAVSSSTATASSSRPAKRRLSPSTTSSSALRGASFASRRSSATARWYCRAVP
jgi:tetratricopeptide (TPR) repeat protein